METNLSRFKNVGVVAASLGLLPIFVGAQDATGSRTPVSSTAAAQSEILSAVPTSSPPQPQVEDGFFSRIRAEDLLKYDWGKWQLKPRLSTSASFTDNFQYRESKLAESDEIVSVSPGFQIQYGSEDYNHVLFDYSHDQIFYLSHANFDTEQDHLRLLDQIAYNRWSLTGNDQVDFFSSFIGVANTSRTVLVNRQRWIDDYKLVLDASTRLKPFIEAYHSDIQYDPNPSFYNGQLLKGKLGTSYVLTSRVNLSSDLYYGQEAPSKTLTNQPPVFYNTIIGAGFGATGEFTSRLRGSVHFGYELRTVPHNPLVQERGSPTVEVDLTYTPSYYNQIVLSVSRNTAIAASTPTTSIANRVNLTATQYLTVDLKWALQLSLGASLVDYTDTVGGPLPIPFPVHTPSGDGTATLYSLVHTARNDQDYNLGLNLNYSPNRWLRITVGIAIEDYSLNYRDRAYSLFNAATPAGLKPYQVKSALMQLSVGF